MRTKEEIIKNRCSQYNINGVVMYAKDGVDIAMDECAKESAIAFAEWCDKNEFTQSSAGLWYSDLDGFKYIGYTTAELYDIFNNENQEK